MVLDYHYQTMNYQRARGRAIRHTLTMSHAHKSGRDTLNLRTASPIGLPVINGGDDRDRTDNLCLAKAALSQLSYIPTEFNVTVFNVTP